MKTIFIATVHQAMIACCDGDLTACDLYTHLIGDGSITCDLHDDASSLPAGMASSNHSDLSVAFPDKDLGVFALVAESLGNLLST